MEYILSVIEFFKNKINELNLSAIDISKMSTGEMMFYGGIAGAIFFILLALVTLKRYKRKRKKLLNKIMKNMV